jgi:hypothetical protein
MVSSSPTPVPPHISGMSSGWLPRSMSFLARTLAREKADSPCALHPGTWTRFSRGCGRQQPRAVGVASRFQRVFEALGRLNRAPHPPLPTRSLSYSPACSFNKGGGWIKCLGRIQQHQSPFWQRKGSTYGITFQMQGWGFGKDRERG